MTEMLEIIRGDDVSINFTYKDADGDPIDITGYAIFLTAKTEVDEDDTDADAVISKKVTSHSDPVNGESVITLTDSETDIPLGSYTADIQVIDDSDIIVSSSKFVLKIFGDVTRRIT